MSGTGGNADDRRQALRDAFEAVRSDRPDSDEQAVELLSRELQVRGITDVSEEAITKAAPLCRMPRWFGGLRATRIVVGTFAGLSRDFLAQAEPKWLAPAAPPSFLQAAPGQTMRGTAVILDPSAQPILNRIAAERPRNDDRSICFLASLVRDGRTAVAVHAGTTVIGHLDAAAAEAVRSPLTQHRAGVVTEARFTDQDARQLVKVLVPHPGPTTATPTQGTHG